MGSLFNDENAYQDAEGGYRYLLGRRWGRSAPWLYVMLNPSSATDNKRDNTLSRCVSFASDGDAGALEIVNLFAFRTPHPSVLMAQARSGADIVGPRNDESIVRAVERVGPDGTVVFAWGAQAITGMESRVDFVERVVGSATVARVVCFGFNEDGSPRHPLMLNGATPLVPFKRTVGAHRTAKERKAAGV